ncbi:hypothetical protein [Mammaliicoccus sciuri]|uniref:hypothetical protein n=1 Tax=Mammaliicoccus sciuri TaxID=1296 RepID=UPI003F55F0CA
MNNSLENILSDFGFGVQYADLSSEEKTEVDKIAYEIKKLNLNDDVTVKRTDGSVEEINKATNRMVNETEETSMMVEHQIGRQQAVAESIEETTYNLKKINDMLSETFEEFIRRSPDRFEIEEKMEWVERNMRRYEDENEHFRRNIDEMKRLR